MGIPFAEDGDFVTINDELAILCFDNTSESTMSGIIFEHVHHVFQINEWVVDGNNVDGAWGNRSAEHKTTDTTKTVDTNLRLHA